MNPVEKWTQQIETCGIAHVMAKRRELMAAVKATMQEATAVHDEWTATHHAAGEARDAARKALREYRLRDSANLVTECNRLHDLCRPLKERHEALKAEFWLYHDSIKALDEATGGLCECCWEKAHAHHVDAQD